MLLPQVIYSSLRNGSTYTSHISSCAQPQLHCWVPKPPCKRHVPPFCLHPLAQCWYFVYLSVQCIHLIADVKSHARGIPQHLPKPPWQQSKMPSTTALLSWTRVCGAGWNHMWKHHWVILAGHSTRLPAGTCLLTIQDVLFTALYCHNSSSRIGGGWAAAVIF